MNIPSAWCLWGLLAVGAIACGPGASEVGLDPEHDEQEQALASTVPGQFLAKLYTEVLGRAPDPSGWAAYSGFFTRNGCSRATLEQAALAFFSSAELASRGYGPEEKVLVLYRTLLSREPDPGGYAGHLQVLRGGGKLSDRVLSFTRSAEFIGRVGRTCSALPAGWGPTLAIPIPVDGQVGFLGKVAGQTGADLQRLLNARRGLGGTVLLAPRALVEVKEPLVVPAGVTLATRGSPGPSHYARMGRLVRSAPLLGRPVVKLEAGASLLSVFVDGQTAKVSSSGGRSHTVNIEGDGATVRSCRLSDGQGTALYLAGALDGVNCQRASVSRNLITGYGALYMGAIDRFMDGVTNRCAGAVIEDNQIVDATDVGIVTFHPGTGVQSSTVRRNVIIAAGNPMVAGLGVDPETGFTPQAGTRLAFTGFRATDNLLWTSPTAHFGIVLSVGTRAWFPDGVAVGGTVENNSTGTLSARANNGLLIATMDAPRVQGNVLRLELQKLTPCASGASLAARDSTRLTDVQSFAWVDTAAVTSCVSHRWP